MARLLVLDNYDSFTYNLVHLLRELDCSELDVIRNDRIDLSAVAAYDRIVLSPGPGIPSEAGIMPALVKEYAASKAILGVCLGHQCIAEVFGCSLSNMENVIHGKAVLNKVVDRDEALFKGLPKSFMVGRYHSWLVESCNFSDDLVVTAVDQQGDIMALRHRAFNVRGLQFHPESVLTEYGAEMLSNWLKS